MTNRKKEIDEFLKALKKLWLKYPELRFFQLLFNFSRLGTRGEVGFIHDPFYYLDDEILMDIMAELMAKR